MKCDIEMIIPLRVEKNSVFAVKVLVNATSQSKEQGLVERDQHYICGSGTGFFEAK